MLEILPYKILLVFAGLLFCLFSGSLYVKCKTKQCHDTLCFKLLRDLKNLSFVLFLILGVIVLFRIQNEFVVDEHIFVYLRVICILISSVVTIKAIGVVERHFIKVQGAQQAFIINVLGTISKIVCVIIVLMMLLDKFGVNISGIIAIGGVGGIAVGLAAKDLFANFFGFMMLVMDRPFKIGDLISTSDKNLRGVVQSIGWRVTQTINLEKKPVYVPNSLFLTSVLYNETNMLARRVHESLKFKFSNLHDIELFTQKVRDWIAHCEFCDSRFASSFAVTAMGNTIVEMELVAYTTNTSWVLFCIDKEKILLQIFEFAKAQNLSMLRPDVQIFLSES